MFQPETEACAGCDAMPPKGLVWAWVGVMRDEGVPPTPFVARPVCGECWSEPKSRKRVLKAHFFPRLNAEWALAKAGATDLVGHGCSVGPAKKVGRQDGPQLSKPTVE